MTEHADSPTQAVHVDGNALAGPMSDLFAFDITTAEGTCDGCGTSAHLAQARVFGHETARVLRCAGCDHVLARIVTTTRSLSFDLVGLRTIRVALAD